MITMVARLLLRFRAELLTAAAVLAGWGLVTWGAAALTSWQAWPLSGGLLLLSLAGWRLLFTIARDGLYALTRPPRSPDA